jgi:predicted protein tyrosine phosphatase
VRAELTKRGIAHSTPKEVRASILERMDVDETLSSALTQLEAEAEAARGDERRKPSSAAAVKTAAAEAAAAEARAAMLPELLAVARAGESWVPPPLPAGDDLSPELRALVSAMLAWDPAARPSPKDLLAHPRVQEASALQQAREDPSVPTSQAAVMRAQAVAAALERSGGSSAGAAGAVSAAAELSHEDLDNLVMAFKGLAPFGARGAAQVVPPGVTSRRIFRLLLDAAGLRGLFSEELLSELEVGHHGFVSWKDFVAGLAALAKRSSGERDAHMRAAFKAFDVAGRQNELTRLELEEMLAVFGLDTSAPLSTAASQLAPTAARSSSSSAHASAAARSSRYEADSSVSGAGAAPASPADAARGARNALVAAFFRSFDADGNGVITRAEFEAALASTKPCSICRLDVDKVEYMDHLLECRARVFREKAAELGARGLVPAAAAALFEPSSHLGGVVLRPKPTDNAVLVRLGLYLGNQWAATGDGFLVPHRVRGVVNCAMREAATLTTEQRAAFGVLEVRGEDILDIEDVDFGPEIRRAAGHVRDLLALYEGDGGAVLVHCVQGVSRSATVVTAFLVLHCGMTLLDAAALVRKARWQAMPNLAFWRCLRQIELEARAGASTVPEEALRLHWSVVTSEKSA